MKSQSVSIQGLGQNEDFLKKAYRAALIPCILSILSGCINIIADGIIVGQKIGANGLTAINLCIPVYLILCIIGSLFVSGAAISASNEIGKDNFEAAQKYYGIALGICTVSSLIMAVVGVFLSGVIAKLLCSDPLVLEMVEDYTKITLIGALPKIMIYIPFWFLRLDGKNKTITVMMTVMGFGNILLDLLFLFVFDMGVSGAALASVIATGLACLIGFIWQHKGDAMFKFRPSSPEKKKMKSIFSAGSPAALNNLMQTGRLLTMNLLLMSNGGSEAVAAFSVVNGISAFAEAVTVGVPQAATAMLGVYHGEHDNKSVRIMIKQEVINGIIYCLMFGLVIGFGSGVIGILYGLDFSVKIPMICLALSLIPALFTNILSGFYNVSGHSILSNQIIISRVFLFPVTAFVIMLSLNGPVWLFLPLGEILTLLIWLYASWKIQKKKGDLSRFLLLDTRLEKSGNIINFSVKSDNEDICSACEKITDFCSENGMARKQTMSVSLALEELMTLITQKNTTQKVNFDIRLFSLQGTIGIRIRYDGRDLNPLAGDRDSQEYMGIAMIEKLVQEVVYKRVFGLNSMLILI